MGLRPDRPANRPLPRGSGIRASDQATGLAHLGMGPPLRDSAGISPDFAGSYDEATRYTGVRMLRKP